MQVEAANFDRMKEVLIRKLNNANLNVDRHGTYTRLRALKHIWDVQDVLAELQTLEPAHVQARTALHSTMGKMLAAKARKIVCHTSKSCQVSIG